MRLAAVAHVFGDRYRSWVNPRIPNGYHVPPIKDPPGCHDGRPWTLYGSSCTRPCGCSRHRMSPAELLL